MEQHSLLLYENEMIYQWLKCYRQDDDDFIWSVWTVACGQWSRSVKFSTKILPD